jgi:hypothetical protein
MVFIALVGESGGRSAGSEGQSGEDQKISHGGLLLEGIGPDGSSPLLSYTGHLLDVSKRIVACRRQVTAPVSSGLTTSASARARAEITLPEQSQLAKRLVGLHHVAGMASTLDIGFDVSTTAGNRNYMIELWRSRILSASFGF